MWDTEIKLKSEGVSNQVKGRQVHFSTFQCNLIFDENSLKLGLFSIDLQAYTYCFAQIWSRANSLFCCEDICAGGWYKFKKN